MKFKYIRDISKLKDYLNDKEIDGYMQNKHYHLFGLFIHNQCVGYIGVKVDEVVEILNLICLENEIKDEMHLHYLVNYVKKHYIKKDIVVKVPNKVLSFYLNLGFVVKEHKNDASIVAYMQNDHLITRFLDVQDKVIDYSEDESNKRIILNYIADSFERGKQYDEKEVNEIIKRKICFEDYATIRRDLYEANLLDHTKNCNLYWLK